jgi:two-component system, sensor histidine kinase LadS
MIPPMPHARQALLRVYCLIVGLVLWGHGAVAQTPPPVILLDGQMTSVAMAGRAMYWVDPTGALSLDEVERRQTTLPFAVRSVGHRESLGEKGVLWLKFSALVQDRSTHWELELSRAGTDHISLYHRQTDGQWKAQHAGLSLPVSAWAYPDRYPVFSLDNQATTPVTYWVRVAHPRVPFSGEFSIFSHDELRARRIQQQLLLGAYFGMALLLTLVAVTNALVFRDSSFAAYAGYASLLALWLSSSVGVAGQFLWPESPRWNTVSEFVLMPLVATAGLLFVRHVVQPRRIGRSLDRLSLVLAGTFLAFMVWDVLAPTQTSLYALTVAGALTLVTIHAMMWAAWRTNDRWLRWIVLGIMPVLLAGTLPVLRNFGLISSSLFTQYATVIAAAIECPMLIYGLLQRSSIQHESQARAKALELTEPLTGLINRHNFMLRMHDCLVRSQRYRHQCAVLLITLDNHDAFRSEHGREVADRALVLTGSLLRSVARDVDCAARVGDSEVALLMEGPVRAPHAVDAATAIVAAGLRPSEQLPTGSSLRFKIVIALLPDDGHALQLDSQAHMAWMRDALADLQQEPRKNILNLNF